MSSRKVSTSPFISEDPSGGLRCSGFDRHLFLQISVLASIPVFQGPLITMLLLPVGTAYLGPSHQPLEPFTGRPFLAQHEQGNLCQDLKVDITPHSSGSLLQESECAACWLRHTPRPGTCFFLQSFPTSSSSPNLGASRM